MFYELKTTSSMAKIRKSDAAVVSLIDVFGKEYLVQECESPLALCTFDGETGFFGQDVLPVVPDCAPRVLHRAEKRFSAVLKHMEKTISVSYTVDEDGLGVSFMADENPAQDKKMCVAVRLKSFSYSGDGTDYRMIFSDGKNAGFQKSGDESFAESVKIEDASFEISSSFNGNGAEFKLSGEWNVYARAGKDELSVFLIPLKDGEQFTFKMNMV